MSPSPSLERHPALNSQAEENADNGVLRETSSEGSQQSKLSLDLDLNARHSALSSASRRLVELELDAEPDSARTIQVEPASSEDDRKQRGRGEFLEGHAEDDVDGEGELGNFGQSLQIDMKGLVGDAVGNMSISPGSRDVVLAARRGLYIIDLEAPFEVPRFLPQGGTWDVADVQWNPHPSHRELVVSTSSEKLLIWNLLFVGKTSIEHILRSHYRAITDINWHTTEPDTVVSTGIDSWLWAWDLRDTKKPILGLCAFNAGGTQVKWNRRDPNMLASSHMNEVLVWDRRKGSLPVTRIRAHNSKIYGIDWVHHSSTELVTCSLDRTIKVWDVQDAAPNPDGDPARVPKATIGTHYPVWRARALPFARGVLSLPQRGETALEMWANDDPLEPVVTFEGHTDVVKEFVWRKGGGDGNEYQLITWSKDRTLRFWPCNTETVQKFEPSADDGTQNMLEEMGEIYSFRDTIIGTDHPPALSAPVGHRSILAEVRAPLPPRPAHQQVPPPRPRVATDIKGDPLRAKLATSSPSVAAGPGGSMSRGNIGGRSSRMDALTWMSSVKVGESRESSSGPGSGAESGHHSRYSSTSRPGSNQDQSQSQSVSFGRARRSESRSRDREEGSRSLQDEITTVLNKLASSKIKLEKHDWKKRTCTLGLNGPWGEGTSVFIRITFTFPKNYLQAAFPEAVPAVDLEKSPLISLQTRASMLRRLRNIRERRRPCLEPCLRFLLFGDEDEHGGVAIPLEAESSSDEEDGLSAATGKNEPAMSLRVDQNLGELRTSQGIFGPNGQLIRIVRGTPRLIKNPLEPNTDAGKGQSDPDPRDARPRLFQSPTLISDAVRRLGAASADPSLAPSEGGRSAAGDGILRVMSTLFALPEQKSRRELESKTLHDTSGNDSTSVLMRNNVVLANPAVSIPRPDREVAREYIFQAADLAAVCEENAAIARSHGRYDHQRVFETLKPLLTTRLAASGSGLHSILGRKIVGRLYADMAQEKDVQMLGMISSIILQGCRFKSAPVGVVAPGHFETTPLVSAASRLNSGDYFSLARRKDQYIAASPHWPRLPSTKAPPPINTSALSSSGNSSYSRGSWSSLFNREGMKNLMAGVQDTFRDGPGSTNAVELVKSAGNTPTGVPMNEKSARSQGQGRRQSLARTSSIQSAQSQHVSRSWNEASAFTPVRGGVSFSSAGHGGGRRSTWSQVISPTSKAIPEKKVLHFEAPEESFTSPDVDTFEPPMVVQFVCHVLAYAEVLFVWQLPHKRQALLKSVMEDIRALLPRFSEFEHSDHLLGIFHRCLRCGHALQPQDLSCLSCTNTSVKPNCSFCRLPVKGLSHTCVRCLHVTHVKCWRMRHLELCGSGCGCRCAGFPSNPLASLNHPDAQSPLSLLAELPVV